MAPTPVVGSSVVPAIGQPWTRLFVSSYMQAKEAGVSALGGGAELSAYKLRMRFVCGLMPTSPRFSMLDDGITKLPRLCARANGDRMPNPDKNANKNNNEKKTSVRMEKCFITVSRRPTREAGFAKYSDLR